MGIKNDQKKSMEEKASMLVHYHGQGAVRHLSVYFSAFKAVSTYVKQHFFFSDQKIMFLCYYVDLFKFPQYNNDFLKIL